MMKKEKMKLKALMLSLALAALMLPVTTVSAQGYHGGSLLDDYYAEQDASSQGGLLRSGSSGGYSLSNEQFSGGDGGYQLSNETFGQDAPLGSGLFILAAAGAAYALKKRKTNK